MTTDPATSSISDTSATSAASARPVQVFLVDDHSMFRAGVRAELTNISEGRVVVVGEAGTVAEAQAGIVRTEPDVVLLDVHMPDGGGLAVLRACLDHQLSARFLCLSVSDAAEDVIALIRAGARGYVTKSISGPELVEAVLRVHTGDAVFSPRLAGYVLDAFSSDATPASTSYSAQTSTTSSEELQNRGVPVEEVAEVQEGETLLDELTKREREVLRLLARGYTYREMAEKLFISVKTVETHVSNILRKTQHTNRHSLSRWVTDHNL